jgi:hypothetical protein
MSCNSLRAVTSAPGAEPTSIWHSRIARRSRFSPNTKAERSASSWPEAKNITAASGRHFAIQSKPHPCDGGRRELVAPPCPGDFSSAHSVRAYRNRRVPTSRRRLRSTTGMETSNTDPAKPDGGVADEAVDDSLSRARRVGVKGEERCAGVGVGVGVYIVGGERAFPADRCAPGRCHHRAFEAAAVRARRLRRTCVGVRAPWRKDQLATDRIAALDAVGFEWFPIRGARLSPRS